MDLKNWILDGRICWAILLAFGMLTLFPPGSNAALVESRLAEPSVSAERDGQIETIRQALETEIVSQRLADYGLSGEEIEAKLHTLSDEQLHQLASLSEDLAAGGVLGAVIAVLVIVLLVIVILKISDRQIVVR